MSTLSIPDVWLPLERKRQPLASSVTISPAATEIVGRFDYKTTGTTSFLPWEPPNLPDEWSIGAIVGGSGSGKSTLLADLATPTRHEWDNARPIIDHLGADAAERFYAVGLSSVPTWVKPYAVLSNGEKFRADMARQLEGAAAVDEFTSVVDRTIAQAVARSVGRYVRSGAMESMIVATVHRDVLPWLEPDWVIDTDAGMWAMRPRECLHRGPMVADVYEVSRTMWAHYMEHHYLTHDLHPFARCYIAVVSDAPAAFAAAIPFPHGRIKSGWRGTRLVTHPDFQGLGIGPRLADWVAEAHVRAGHSYYAKTTHPRLGEYRDAHPNWHATTHSRRKKPTPRSAPRSFATRRAQPWVGSLRPSYSHRYEINRDGGAA